MAGDMDQGLKRLCQLRAQDLVSFGLPGAELLAPLPTDLAAEPQLVTDTLFHARYHGDECLIDLEIEAAPTRAIGDRLYRYGSRIYGLYGFPVLSVVLWLQRGHGGRPPDSPHVISVGSEWTSMWRFWGTAVYDIPAELLLESAVVGLLPLVPFTRGGAGRRVIERAAREIEARAPTDQLVPLETLLAVFGARSLGPDAMRAIIRRLSMNTEILEQSPLYREWIQEGRASGAREAVLVAWRSRFGEADADVVANLEGRQDADDLFAIAGGVFGATDLTAARALLGLAAPEPRP